MSTVTFNDIVTPSVPGVNKQKIYSKSDGFLYVINSAGVERRLSEIQTNSISSHIETVNDKTYSLIYSARVSGLIVGINARLLAGSTNITIKINGVAVTGLNLLTVTTANKSGVATALNSFVVGNKIELTVSGSSAATDLQFTLETLDA